MGLVSTFRKNKMKNVHFLKISLLVQFGEKIKATLCSDDSIIIMILNRSKVKVWIVNAKLDPDLEIWNGELSGGVGGGHLDPEITWGSRPPLDLPLLYTGVGCRCCWNIAWYVTT